MITSCSHSAVNGVGDQGFNGVDGGAGGSLGVGVSSVG